VTNIHILKKKLKELGDRKKKQKKIEILMQLKKLNWHKQD